MQDESGHLRKKIYILAVFNNYKCQKKRSNQPVQQQSLHMQNVGKTLYSGNDTESELQEYWNETLHWKSYSKNALRCFHKGKEESVSQIILWSYSCAAVEAPLVLMQRTHSHCRQIEWAKMYYVLEQSAFISFGCFQAFPELPEDVLRVHADVVQRSCLAQYNPSDNSQSAARCGEEGHLEGVVAHHCWTHTGDCLHVHRH